MERPLRELIDERIKWPAATALRRRRRARPRPGIGNGAVNAAMPTAFGVVFDRIDERARFLHLVDGVLEIGAAAGSVNAVGEKHDGFAALNRLQAVNHLVN